MSLPFPQHPYLSGNFAPILMEADAPDLPVIGALPKELRGTLFALPKGDAISEPVFVPRRADGGEGEGWLLAVAYRGAEKRSDLLVFAGDARSDGPIATAQLSHRVPFGFHGCWRAGD